MQETKNFKKYIFPDNVENQIAMRYGKCVGIENLFPESCFTDDVYNQKEIQKNVQQSQDSVLFERFDELINRIKNILL